MKSFILQDNEELKLEEHTKGVLIFDKDDETSLIIAMKGAMYYSALYDIKNYIRSKIKYTDVTDSEEQILEEIREFIPDLDDV